MRDVFLQQMNACLAGIGGGFAYLLSNQREFTVEVIAGMACLTISYVLLYFKIQNIKEDK